MKSLKEELNDFEITSSIVIEFFFRYIGCRTFGYAYIKENDLIFRIEIPQKKA